MKKTRLILGLVVSMMLISCHADKTSEKFVSHNDKAKKVTTMVVEEESLSNELSYSGIITPITTTPLSFQLPGSLYKIYVDEGDQVKKDQLIAVQDKASYKSAFEAANAMKKQAEDAYHRLKSVYDKGSLPEIKWEKIKSQLEQAKSAAEIARKNLINCEIKAPADGVIGSRNAEVGSTVIPGNPVFRLIEIRDVFVRVSVPENEVNKIKIGQKANISVPAIGSHLYSGVVEKVGVMANPISKTYDIKIRVNNKKTKLKPGMVCNADVIVESNEGEILIPFQAVIKNGDDLNYVFLVNKKKNVVEKKMVKVGGLMNNKIQIISGVEFGDVLVVEGQHKLLDNNKVIF